MEDKTKTQEEKQYVEEVAADDEDDLDDGPPPGFQCIFSPQPVQAKITEIDEDDEGPPPGFHFIALKPSRPSLSSVKESSEQKDDEGEDGPPPGWELFPLANALPRTTSEAPDCNMQSQVEQNEHEGSPPGWETLLDNHMPPPSNSPLFPCSSVPFDTERGSINNTAGKINCKSQPKSESTTLLTAQQSSSFPLVSQSTSLSTLSPPPPPSQIQQLSTSASPDEPGCKVDIKNGSNRSISGQNLSPKYPPPPARHPPAANTASPLSEKAQLVCGNCLKLLLYPRGVKWVQCSGCQEVNFVLEAHEVGQVKCGNCSVLLMYPYGAPAVQCTSCRSVTEIGVSNTRPPLSVQQAQRRKRPTRGGVH